MASITKSGTSWRCQVYVGGTRDSDTFPTRAKAAAWGALRETQLRTQKETGILAGKTCEDAFDRYAKEVSPTKGGRHWEVRRLAFLGREFGEIKLVDMTADVIGQWRNRRLKGTPEIAKVSGSTVNRDMNLLSHVFSTARKEWGWMAHSPTTDVRRPKEADPRERLISSQEIELMCLMLGFDGTQPETDSGRVAVAWLFAIETGMRLGEICKLQSAMIAGPVAHLPAAITKTRVKRDVPLNKRALQLLALLPRDTLFGMDSKQVDALFRKAWRRAGITGMTFHDSRHEAITRLSRKLDVLALARMVGHRNIDQLRTYYNESAASIAARLD